MKTIVTTFTLVFVFSGCDWFEKKKEKEVFSFSPIVVMDEENNPIPKELYTLPSAK